MTQQNKPTAIVVCDGTRESEVLLAVAKTKHEVIEVDLADSTMSDLLAATAVLAQVASAAKSSGGRIAFLPLRCGRGSSMISQAVEWQQTAEELLRHGHTLDGMRLEMPLLDLDDTRFQELATQLAVGTRQAEAA